MDKLIANIASYAFERPTPSTRAFETAHYCLFDALACAAIAAKEKSCQALIQPLFKDGYSEETARVPFSSIVTDPLQACFSFGTMIRWVDFNDTYIGKEWAHPSDALGALLPLLEVISKKNAREGKPPLKINDLLQALITSYEIQGRLADNNSVHKVGLDHVFFLKIAVAAVATCLLGGSATESASAISQAFIDSGSLRTYRHAPNTGSRKSWAAADASRRGLWLAYISFNGEPGYSTPLSAPKWGFQDVFLRGELLQLEHKLGSHVMEHVLFKPSFPSEFHAQTAIEIAIKLHPLVKNKWNQIEQIVIDTHEAAIKIIDKKGPLYNFADRDHCLQYMVAMGLIHGKLTHLDFSDEASSDPLIDTLRERMEVREYPPFTRDYLDPLIKSTPSQITILLKDGTRLGPQTLHFSLGHPRRREDGWKALREKASSSFTTCLPDQSSKQLLHLFDHPEEALETTLEAFIDQCKVFS